VSEIAAANGYFREGLACGRRASHERLVATALSNLGDLARQVEEWVEAREWLEQSLEVARGTGDADATRLALHNLASVVFEQDDLEAAERYHRESLSISEALKDRHAVSLTLDGLGALAARQGSWERAAQLAEAAEALREQTGGTVDAVELASRERYLAAVRAALGDDALAASSAAVRARSLDEMIAYALEGGAS
jgi:tetratricopeptide (TPR) repeat protein